MFKFHNLTGALVVLSLAAGITVAHAAETGTKTFPTSSIYPPQTPPPVFDSGSHHWCYLPNDGCDVTIVSRTKILATGPLFDERGVRFHSMGQAKAAIGTLVAAKQKDLATRRM